MDAKPRELYLLFRAYDGYENSQLKVTSKNGKTTSVSSPHSPLESLTSHSIALNFIAARWIRDVRHAGERRRRQTGSAGNI